MRRGVRRRGFPASIWCIRGAGCITLHDPSGRDELHRVLRHGGQARVMVYHRPSIVGFMLWFRYGLMAGLPRRTLPDLYAEHLESPGTKGYTVKEGEYLLRSFCASQVRSRLSFGDLLQGDAGRNHEGAALRALRSLWPRRSIERLFPGCGLYLLMEATK